MADSEEAVYIEPKDISIVMYGRDNPSCKPAVNSNRGEMEPEYRNVKATRNNRHFGIMIFVGVAVAVTCVAAAVVVVVSTLNDTAAVEALENGRGFGNKNIGNDQIQATTGTTRGNANTTLGTNDMDEKVPLESACFFRKGYFPRQVVTLTDGYDVLCDTVSDGGGWIIFQRRTSSDVDFNRNWQNYTDGFGDLTGNFWLGLDKVYNLCNQVHNLFNQNLCELRVDFMYQDVTYYAEYKGFELSGPGEKYTLHVGAYHGTAGDSMKYDTGQKFSTSDQDNDRWTGNCVTVYGGPWWHNTCGRVHFNGLWGSKVTYKGLNYYEKTGWVNSATSTEMKLRFGRRE